MSRRQGVAKRSPADNVGLGTRSAKEQLLSGALSDASRPAYKDCDQAHERFALGIGFAYCIDAHHFDVRAWRVSVNAQKFSERSDGAKTYHTKGTPSEKWQRACRVLQRRPAFGKAGVWQGC